MHSIWITFAWLLLTVTAAAQPPEGGRRREDGPSSGRPNADRPNGGNPPGTARPTGGPGGRGAASDWNSFWQKISLYDQDHDEVITGPEMTDSRLKAMTDRADTDHDGKTTKAEWQALYDRESKTFSNAGPGGGPGGPGGGPRGPGAGPSGSGGRGPGGPGGAREGSSAEPPPRPPRVGGDNNDGGNRDAPPPRPERNAPREPGNAQPAGGSTAAIGPIRSRETSVGRHEWLGWRGDGTNVFNGSSLPVSWSKDNNVAWRVEVPGYGWSSPIVLKDRIVVTTAVASDQTPPERYGPGSGQFDPPDSLYRFDVLCYSLVDGTLLWRETLAEKKPQFAIHPSNTYATETPVSDGESIFVRFGEVGLACLSRDGQVRWKKEIGPYRMQGGWGTSSNPLLTDEGVLLQIDSETESYAAMFDKADGHTIWRVDRRERSAWSTPYYWRNRLRDEVVLIGAKSIRAYDPKDGRELWSLGATGSNPAARQDDPAFIAGSCKASPVGDEDILLVGKGNRAKAGSSQFGPFWAVKPGGSGDINLDYDAQGKPGSNPFVAWYREDAGPVIASPLMVDGLIYITPRNGSTFHCLNTSDGSTVYSHSFGREQHFFVTPWAADGLIYAMSGGGKTFIFKTGPKFELIATNDLEEHTFAAPALIDGAMIFRTATQLYCIGSPPTITAPTTATRERRGTNENRPDRGSSTRLIQTALAVQDLTDEQKTTIQRLAAEAEDKLKTAASSSVSRAAERIRDELRIDVEAALTAAQKKELRTKLAEGSGDPGAANGGPITTLREQLAQVGLSKEQEFEVQTLVLQLRDDIGRTVRESTGNRGTAIRNVTEETKQKIIALLNDEQREKLKKLGR